MLSIFNGTKFQTIPNPPQYSLFMISQYYNTYICFTYQKSHYARTYMQYIMHCNISQEVAFDWHDDGMAMSVSVILLSKKPTGSCGEE